VVPINLWVSNRAVYDKEFLYDAGLSDTKKIPEVFVLMAVLLGFSLIVMHSRKSLKQRVLT
jgi:hypothetical protein